MSNYKIQNLPLIKLTDLLRRRKTTLKKFLQNMGIVTYTTLEQKCKKMGVSPPTEDLFKEALGSVVSSPQEGILVLDPPLLTKESGQKVPVDSFADALLPVDEEIVDEQSEEPEVPKRRRKKKSLLNIESEES